MEAEEIRIKDFVMLPTGFVGQVMDIHYYPEDDEWRCKVALSPSWESYTELISVSELKGVPVTGDMLQAWGIKFNAMKDYIYRKNNPWTYISVCPPQPDNDDWWSPGDTGFQVNTNTADIIIEGLDQVYVHQLQHAIYDLNAEFIINLWN